MWEDAAAAHPVLHAGKEKKPVGPFHIPWSSFAAFLLVLVALLLALGWALWDARRDGKGGDR